ncbi:MAG: Hsp20/alpha crystallin family protein [Verrucomicrobia bacterium]|nr:Hsp20/alpha crystallin family protein [Verrucomicrobiota bacterium]
MAMCKVSSPLHFLKSPRPQDGRETSSGTSWVPNTDVYLSDAGIVIKVELAGMRREDLELTVEGNQLRISGQRPDGCRPPKCTFLVMEIDYGAFESVIELPEGFDLGQARAAYQNGFLRIDVPQQKRPPSKSISVLIQDGE